MCNSAKNVIVKDCISSKLLFYSNPLLNYVQYFTVIGTAIDVRLTSVKLTSLYTFLGAVASH